MNSKFKMIAVAVAAVSFMVGCNKKSDDGAVAQGPPPPTTCVVGQMPPAGYICQNGQLIPSAVGGIALVSLPFEATYMTGTLQINAQGPINGVASPGQNGIYSYNGPINFGGMMQASNTICYNGNAPTGGYTITGTGNLSNGVITGASIVFNFIGGGLALNFSGSVIPYLDKVSLIGHLNNSTNGTYCGPITTY